MAAQPLVAQEAAVAAHLLQQHFGILERLDQNTRESATQAASRQGAEGLPQHVRGRPGQETLAAEWRARLQDYARGCLSTLSRLADRGAQVGIAIAHLLCGMGWGAVG